MSGFQLNALPSARGVKRSSGYAVNEGHVEDAESQMKRMRLSGDSLHAHGNFGPHSRSTAE